MATWGTDIPRWRHSGWWYFEVATFWGGYIQKWPHFGVATFEVATFWGGAIWVYTLWGDDILRWLLCEMTILSWSYLRSRHFLVTTFEAATLLEWQHLEICWTLWWHLKMLSNVVDFDISSWPPPSHARTPPNVKCLATFLEWSFGSVEFQLKSQWTGEVMQLREKIFSVKTRVLRDKWSAPKLCVPTRSGPSPLSERLIRLRVSVSL